MGSGSTLEAVCDSVLYKSTFPLLTYVLVCIWTTLETSPVSSGSFYCTFSLSVFYLFFVFILFIY